METITIQQARQLVKDQGFRHVCLLDHGGRKVIFYNKPGKPIEPKLKQIEDRLKLLNGRYTLRFQNTVRADDAPFDYAIDGGQIIEQEDVPSPPLIVPRSSQDPSTMQDSGKSVLSYEEALRLHREIAEKDYKIALLESKLKESDEIIVALESDIAEMEAGLEDEPEENTQISQVSEILVPLADKYLEIKEQQNALKALELQGKGLIPQAGQPQMEVVPEQQQQPNQNQAFWDQYQKTLQTDPGAAQEMLEQFYLNQNAG